MKNGRTNTIVSTRKEELDNILDAFAIQVENPFAVLNQEVSREFLSNASPASMYSYFMKATELEKLSSDYKQIITFKVDIDVTLEHKKTTMKRMKDEITALKARYDDLKEIHTLGVRISELKKELTWAFVREEELKGLKIESELSKQQAALATLEDHLKQLVAVESSAMQELKRIEGIMANSSHISLEITNRLQDKRKERDVARKKVAECNQKIQNIKETASRLESQLKSIESKINEKLKRISQNSR